jgi:hypothetical protein
MCCPWSSHDLFEHGESLYRPESRVPLLFVLPSGADAGDVVRQTVSLRDLPATVVDLAGVAVGSPFPGRSLARLWDSSHQSTTTASDSDGALSELPDPNPTEPSRGRSPAAHGPLLSLAQGNYCAADCVPIGLPRMVMPSGNGRAAMLKPFSDSSLRSRR